MQYEISFVGGPRNGDATVYGQSVQGLVYALKNETDGPWHYYLLKTKGAAKVPDFYIYVGETLAILCGVAEVEAHFANPPEE